MVNGTTSTNRLMGAVRPKRAVILVRARSNPYDAARESAQLESQRQACERVAEQLGAVVVKVYAAHGGTTDASVRALIDDLLQTMERGAIDYLIVQSFDRLTRSPGELARIVLRLAATGTALVTTADPAAAFVEQVRLFCLIKASRTGRRVA